MDDRVFKQVGVVFVLYILAIGGTWYVLGGMLEEAEAEAAIARKEKENLQADAKAAEFRAEGVKAKYEWRIEDIQNLPSKCNGRLNVVVAGDGWWGYGYVQYDIPLESSELFLVDIFLMEGQAGEVKKIKQFGGRWKEVAEAEGIWWGYVGNYRLMIR